ncbi:uncharacterized protein [Venturia canescens]|uniref:uncharacterized protein n=1 Tax=Venturia canescens TaxID=32260 RepID=UPI001C9C4AF0|nr:uncharacterized protein LOC122412385 [Venturia canescens]
MCDSFEMACRDSSNALQLNIKVNSENLLPHSQKYNVSSLRVPDDPSWPKIPQRKLIDDLDDIIEPPCVVTLTGTPRKSRSTVRPSNSHQSSRSNFMRADQVPASLHPSIYQKTQTSSQPAKRRPGCADPRFKNFIRVTTVKSQMTSTDPPDRNNHTESSRSAVVIPNQTQSILENVRKTVPEKDTDAPKVNQREAEKPGEIRGMESIGVQTVKSEQVPDHPSKDKSKNSEVSEDTEKLKETMKSEDEVKTETKNVKSTCDDECWKKEETGERCLSEGANADGESQAGKINAGKESRGADLSSDLKAPITPHLETSCLQCCNNTGQLFLVVENKAPTTPVRPAAMQMDSKPPLSSCEYTTQCYNVQVPVLSYQNLPLQISTQQAQKVEMSLGPVLTIPSTPAINGHHLYHHHHHQLDLAKANFSRITEAPECLNKEKPSDVVKVPNDADTSETLRRTDKKESSSADADRIDDEVEAHRMRKTMRTPPVKLERKPEIISESYKASRVPHLLSSDTTDSEFYDLGMKQSKASRAHIYSKGTSGSGSDYEMTANSQYHGAGELDPQTKKKKRNPTYRSTRTSQEVYSQNYDNNSQTEASRRVHRKMKSEQNLSHSSAFAGKNHISDPYITGRREAYGFIKEGSKDKDRLDEETARDNTDLTTDELDSDIPNITDCCETRRTDISNVDQIMNNETTTLTVNETTVIPVKTQRLLNKSYMEYYDKLRSNNFMESTQQRYMSQMAMGAPQLKKRRAEISSEVGKIIEEKQEAKSEVLTMEKFSALSNIINRNLNSALRNSSDPMQTKQLYVNENMKSSAMPATHVTQKPHIVRRMSENTADLYDSSGASLTLANKVKRKREKPVERRLLKRKTIAFFGVIMYVTIVVLPMMYTYFLYDEYEDYEDLSYIELLLEYVVSSFREAFGGFFDSIHGVLFQPRTCRKCNSAP